MTFAYYNSFFSKSKEKSIYKHLASFKSLC